MVLALYQVQVHTAHIYLCSYSCDPISFCYLLKMPTNTHTGFAFPTFLASHSPILDFRPSLLGPPLDCPRYFSTLYQNAYPSQSECLFAHHHIHKNGVCKYLILLLEENLQLCDFRRASDNTFMELVMYAAGSKDPLWHNYHSLICVPKCICAVHDCAYDKTCLYSDVSNHQHFSLDLWELSFRCGQ